MLVWIRGGSLPRLRVLSLSPEVPESLELPDLPVPLMSAVGMTRAEPC